MFWTKKKEEPKVSGIYSKDLRKRKEQFEETLEAFISTEEKKFKADTGLDMGKIIIEKFPHLNVWCVVSIY